MKTLLITIATLIVSVFLLSLCACNATEPPANMEDRPPAASDIMLSFSGAPPHVADVYNDRTLVVAKGHSCEEAIKEITSQILKAGNVAPPLRAEVAKYNDGMSSCAQALIGIAVANKDLTDAAREASVKAAAEKSKAEKKEETK